MRFAAVVLVLATACFAQEPFTVESNGKQRWPSEEVQKVYNSACAVVQREFGGSRPLRPKVKLILGADKNVVSLDQREIKLVRWDPYLFAQGVVMLAFEDLMPVEQRVAMTKRAMIWADSTLDVKQLAK